MNIYRIELIDRLRATSSRKHSNALSNLLNILEDDRTPDIVVNRVMLDMIISQDKELRATRESDINILINKIKPDNILIPRTSWIDGMTITQEEDK